MRVFQSPERRSARAPWALALLLALPAGACKRPDQSRSYSVTVRVEGDPGRALPGASVSVRNLSVGATGDAGELAVAIRGEEGEHVAIAVSCPEGFRSSLQTADVALHRLAAPSPNPEYDFRCPPERRSVVVVVRAEKGPHLPVLYLGREVGRTDESGAAHVVLRVPANDDVEITLGTKEPGAERLRPQDPSMKFMATDQNAIKIFSVAFEVERDKRPAQAPRASLPIRLN